eukprot:CAMPEP_0185603272 /NCGR_PEP_ID=MMETSP0436-20130131/2328_1 /TAXON_ID=626734 ORGANISM="Favella taraikaensis, Strain Fe Narragansett Bay" /NCGR_SAMPLE_ID=MMETSP0436 /ASSEMBLY_ACC=CAM_ASM_000390 /LENGTH=38 /DNA_ID= /DNA_START= /DNA_END= /DNA_ORIENTATION=
MPGQQSAPTSSKRGTHPWELQAARQPSLSLQGTKQESI